MGGHDLYEYADPQVSDRGNYSLRYVEAETGCKYGVKFKFENDFFKKLGASGVHFRLRIDGVQVKEKTIHNDSMMATVGGVIQKRSIEQEGRKVKQEFRFAEVEFGMSDQPGR